LILREIWDSLIGIGASDSYTRTNFVVLKVLDGCGSFFQGEVLDKAESTVVSAGGDHKTELVNSPNAPEQWQQFLFIHFYWQGPNENFRT